MARKLNYPEKQIFEEIVRDSEAQTVEICAEAFVQRLKERQETPFPLNQLALWLAKDPPTQH
jgi:hypothetical protein